MYFVLVCVNEIERNFCWMDDGNGINVLLLSLRRRELMLICCKVCDGMLYCFFEGFIKQRGERERKVTSRNSLMVIHTVYNINVRGDIYELNISLLVFIINIIIILVFPSHLFTYIIVNGGGEFLTV